MEFSIDVKLTFEAENIKDAKDKIKHLSFILRELNRVSLEINKYEKLFSSEDLK